MAAAPSESTPPVFDPEALRDSIRAAEARLQETRNQLDDLARRAAQAERQEEASLMRIDACSERIRLTRRYLHQLGIQILSQQAEVGLISRSIQANSLELQARRAQLSRRLVGIYKYSRVYSLEAILSRRTLPDLYRRVLGLRWIARGDRQMIVTLRELSQELEDSRARLAAARADLERLAESSRQQEASLQQAYEQEMLLLQSVRGERESNLAVQRQLQNAASELESLLVTLRTQQASRASSTLSLEKLRGKLPWPVPGKVISEFGTRTHPRYRTRTANLGIDIRPDQRSGVTAVAGGRVVFGDRFLGYGNLVIVDHGSGFYTLYGELEELTVGVGTTVVTGSPVGTVTDYLHFEVRLQGQPVDPKAWLVSR